MAEYIGLDDLVVGKRHGIVVPLGDSGEYDDKYTDSPSVINDGNVYKMWYDGFDGSNIRIHYATSTDGIVWDKHGVVIDIDHTAEADVFYVSKPCVIKDSGIYKMWFNSFEDNVYRVRYTTSKDGIVWDKNSVVIDFGDLIDIEEGYDIYRPSVIYDGSIYKMWYDSHYDKNIRIHYATSPDGILWDKHGIVISLVDDDDYKNYIYHTENPCVIYDGKTYRMLYAGDDGGSHSIYYATSINGKIWTHHGEVLPLMNNGKCDFMESNSPCFIQDGTTYKIWYTGYDDSHDKIHYTELTESGLK